jgi:hypothetical protein
MKDANFTINRRAFLGHSQLTPAERRALDSAMRPLMRLPEERWQTVGAIRLDSADPLYMLRIDKSLRALVRPTKDGPPELLDLVRREFLEWYSECLEGNLEAFPLHSRVESQ